MSGQGEVSISEFAKLVLWQATQDGANQIEFLMEEASAPGRHCRIRFKIDGTPYEFTPPPAHIFEQVVAYFLNEATVASAENGSLNGLLRMRRQTVFFRSKGSAGLKELPASNWIVWSDGLDQRLVLTRDATNMAGA